ncbi:mitochondrial amidoxime reducing component 2 isoform X1 [Hydra vulgaris]|uniref:mitochondrial amidoxime reducing component 2 isoform X1 n=1 Tax=Hydra vulgaris TaxID=6087 RepID=UPI001F5ED167|nr:mitochondrial amidoxime reducing component 2 [Hydra vulgaris]
MLELFFIVVVFVVGIFLLINRKKYEVVGYVSSIRTHPLKSAKPIELQHAVISDLGIEFDRQFVLLNEHGTVMTLRKFPTFVLISQKITADGIILEADGHEKLLLPLKMLKADGDHVADIKVFGLSAEGVHVSEDADLWFQKYFKHNGCKLYCFPKDGRPRFTQEKSIKRKKFADDQDMLMFADGCPLLVLSESTVEKLNENLSQSVTINNFRPNIVITGCKPESEYDWHLLKIGSSIIKALYPCVRCVATTVDPFSGCLDSDGEPLKTIQRVCAASKEKFPDFAGKPIFGFNYGVKKNGTIKVGDPVYRIS